MKKLLSIAGLLLLLISPVFSQSESDDEDANVVSDFHYSMNGKGDQYIKIGIMPNFPLNFGDQLYTGGAANLGFYSYLNS